MYHTWSRCAQRAFLCGEDPKSGENFEHRRNWIKSLLEYQAAIFACDVGNYSILSNHQHLIARTRPDIAATWTDEEVAWRWKMAWPQWKDGQWGREPTDEEIEQLLIDQDRIKELRGNLSSLSWLMARWKEPIAKLANAESDTTGHFYEARFGSRELVDEGAILCCSIYVDLNQIKAGISDSLAGSEYSGIQDRLRAWEKNQAETSAKKFHKRKDVEGEYELETSHVEQLLSDCFLSPIDQHGPLMMPVGSIVSGSSSMSSSSVPVESDAAERSPETSTKEPVAESGIEDYPELHNPAASEEVRHCSGVQEGTSREEHLETRTTGKHATWKIHRRYRRRRSRASNQVILSIPFPEYLRIAEWTAEQSLARLTGPPPDDLADSLRERDLDPKKWRAAVDNFAMWFHNAVGKASRLSPILERLNRKWIQGMSHCRDANCRQSRLLGVPTP